jgi:nucleoside-diphosphate-sugar epimerase
MKIFVAGATGAIGRRLVPMLLDMGHDVVATTRSEHKTAGLQALGAQTAVVDGLDRDRVRAAVLDTRPDVIVHQMTALANLGTNLRRFDREFEQTNHLRVQGTEYLLAAAVEAGVGRVVAQSYTGWPNIRSGGPVKTERDPFDPVPPKAQRASLQAIRELEGMVAGATGVEGLALRYGGLYGPGTGLEHGGNFLTPVLSRRFPIVGDGAGVWSFVHIEDAAAATAAAVVRGRPGVYNIVDDDPAPVSEWLPYLARAIGAQPPRRVPRWLGRIAAGEVGVSMMTQIRGSSNVKAKSELGWVLAYPSWREGFLRGLGEQQTAASDVSLRS